MSGQGDELLLGALDLLLNRVDPVPADLVERVQFAIAVDNPHIEVAGENPSPAVPAA